MPGGDGLVWKVGLTVEIKLPFSHFSRVVHETLPQSPLDSWSSTSRPSFFAISSCAISYVMSACFREDACISAGWWKTYRWLVPNITLRRTTKIDEQEKKHQWRPYVSSKHNVYTRAFKIPWTLSMILSSFLWPMLSSCLKYSQNNLFMVFSYIMTHKMRANICIFYWN